MEEKKDVLILAIESSCDETASAVVKNGRGSAFQCYFFSDSPSHALWRRGAEIASRKHIEKINEVIQEALGQAGVKLSEIDAIGVTYNRYTYRRG